jgi:hypothetical protein
MYHVAQSYTEIIQTLNSIAQPKSDASRERIKSVAKHESSENTRAMNGIIHGPSGRRPSPQSSSPGATLRSGPLLITGAQIATQTFLTPTKTKICTTRKYHFSYCNFFDESSTTASRRSA